MEQQQIHHLGSEISNFLSITPIKRNRNQTERLYIESFKEAVKQFSSQLYLISMTSAGNR